MRWTFIWISIFIILSAFFKVNELNYSVRKQIQDTVVRHPDGLPNSQLATITSFGFKNIKADIYWLEAIQYIGGNAIGSEYKKYLFKVLNLITDLNPYFESPYVIGELLLPSYNYRYEDLSDDAQNEYILQSKKLGLKGIENLCDMEKVSKIETELDLKKLWTDKQYIDPCNTIKIPYYLAYIYYFYLHDGEKSAFYYKVTSAIQDTLPGAKIMAAIMQGKSGDRIKAIFMFLSLAQSVDTENIGCHKLAQDIENLAFAIENKKVVLDEKVILALSEASKLAFGKYSEERQGEFFDDTKCVSFTVKALREINLLFLDEADKKFFNAYGVHSRNAKHLYEKGVITSIPVDFQELDDYGVVYEFNKDLGHYDYKMGGYN